MSTAPFLLTEDSIDSTTQPASGNSDQSVLSGLGDLFSGVGAGVASGIAASNAPSTRPITTTGGTLVYNPTTGQYVSATGLTAQSSLNAFLPLLLLGVVLYFVFKK